MEFTKEQLIEHIKGRKEFADECAADSTLHPERREYYELTAEALRIALASLEGEGKLSNFVASQESLGGDFEKVLAENIEELYVPSKSAAPAPVSVPDEMTPKQASRSYCGEVRGYRDGWNACRAVMLQGADGNSPVIPDGWVMVPVDATRAMIDAAARVEEDGYDAMHKAMIAAAPQQEVKP